MTTETATADWGAHLMPAWDAATADLVAEITDEVYPGFLAEASAKLTGNKQPTDTMKRRARYRTSGEVLRRLSKLEYVNGALNPTWNDPEWGRGAALAAKRAGKTPKVVDTAEMDELAAWLTEQTWSDFAQSLAKQYASRGTLSVKQVASARKMQATMEAKARAKASNSAPTPGHLDLSKLPSGYYAVPGGETRLKVRVARPTKASKWHGWVFVSDGAEYGARKNYGRQSPSGLYQGVINTELRAILSDPLEASRAYGRLWGQCGRCGRKLEDADSVANGVGPICAAKWSL